MPARKMPEATVNGTCLYYEEHGRGQPLVMIQGYLGDHSAWFSQVRAFARHFLVVTYDARGIGKSPLSRVPYTIPVMAGDVIGLMDYLKIDRAHLLGLSLGGLVAQAIAIGHPERVRKLVLASTLPGTDAQYAGEQLQALARDPAGLDMDKVIHLLVPLAFNNPVFRLTFKLLAYSRWLTRYCGYVKQMQSSGSYCALPKLHLIQAPTLVITGCLDRVVAPHSSEILAARIPRARLVMVKGGSHALFLEMPRRFNREVLSFLRAPCASLPTQRAP